MYGAVVTTGIESAELAKVQRLISELDTAHAGDEHGAWTRGCEFDKHARGSAVNVDVYDFGSWRGQVLGVVQVRQFERARKNGWGRIRKDYYLIGRNERSGQAFAHAVQWRIVRAAVRSSGTESGAIIRAVESWIWDLQLGELEDLRRCGDTGLVPVVRPPRRADVRVCSATVRVVDSHLVRADEYATDGEAVWARGAVLSHSKRQHRSVRAAGWSRVVIGSRAAHWDFSSPTAD